MKERNYTTDDGGPAFPCEGGMDSGLYSDPGMSLRDWFAGQVLAHGSIGPHVGVIAKKAYEVADAMLAERSKQKGVA